MGRDLHLVGFNLVLVFRESLDVGSDLLCGGMQARLDQLGCFQVIAVDRDRFRCNPALVIGHSVDRHLESRYQHNVGQFLSVQAKKPRIVFRSRFIAEDHSNLPLRVLHNHRFAGAGNDHSLDFGLVAASAKSR